ncbi:hypothetical protein B0H15DRAFT_793145, partial [Mycena belliarum]
MPVDAWDGDTDKVPAQDFLRAFHRNMKPGTSSADMAKAFKNYIVFGSDADRWYNKLSTATKGDMDLIDTAIEAEYPGEVEVQPTEGEYGVMLTKEKIKAEDLGTKVKVADRDVWAHHAWANKVMRLATSAGLSGTATYIEVLRMDLPRQLRTKIPKEFKDWKEFVKAVKDVDAVELELEMNEWREEKAKADRLSQLVERRAAMQASPTAGIRSQLTNTTISAPMQAPRWATAGQNASPFGAAAGGGRGNLFAAPRPYQPSRPLVGDQRRILTEAIARITHHEDTEAGRRAHADQQQEWHRTHGAIPMTVNTPYPLRPGRAPVNSGECFRCGHQGHTNFQRRCVAPQDQCLSIREQQWRRIATQALREAPIAVRAVGVTSWEARTAPEERRKAGWVLGCDEPPPGDASRGPQVRSPTLTPMYTATPESQVIDLYAVGIEESKRASVPFICGIQIEGPRGERVRVRALEDGGALVNAMCTALYEAVRHRIGELERSQKILRMANGALVPSIGSWVGFIGFGRARVRARFEVFPSGGSWSFLFGKPLLEQFKAVHDYGNDTIMVPGEHGPTVVANQMGQ